MNPQEISKLIQECDGFEWDQGNLEKNWKKHRVEALEAEEVFRTHPAIFMKDESILIPKNDTMPLA